MFACATNHAAKELNDDEVINRVLEEGLKLKKKCKSLHRLLEETEAQRNQDRVIFSAAQAKLAADHIHELETMRSEFNIEFTSACETLQLEKDELLRKFDDNSAINAHLQQDNQYLRNIIADFQNQANNVSERSIAKSADADNWKDDELVRLKDDLQTLRIQLENSHQEKSQLEEQVEQLRCENNTLLNTRLSTAALVNRGIESMTEGINGNVVDTIVRRPKHDIQPNDNTDTDMEALQAKLAYAKDEIVDLRNQIASLLNAKVLVEKGVQEVLVENKSLKDNLKSLLLMKT